VAKKEGGGMGEWTWLHTRFPVADIEITSAPLDAKTANVIVRTMRSLPEVNGQAMYEVRVAPHNVAPFRGGPWIAKFTEDELTHPGEKLLQFRAEIATAIELAKLNRKS
jgi:hypothetical protein